jgi:hypothetical protein
MQKNPVTGVINYDLEDLEESSRENNLQKLHMQNESDVMSSIYIT